MGMSRETRELRLGSLVVVKRGHHEGSVFAVVGIEKASENPSDRVLIADGRHVSARKPKRKNLCHVEATGHVSDEIAQRLAGGKNLDDWWLADIIARVVN